mmetsp:Transcript_24069/g.75274  ORF Transcript_24069/g.75274 Transcript_24069/m.75274 type:complete len:344 (+) Transcript_24069:146-1177(+)|eukprot:CAMPEP_0197397934 /NCGR_PEP_ID=MMETSP1165-20131217/12383_1 /TAXON_ID=284809 /ORGANISM="Chrysocystis fragilis, Strain CCMP3189" /LENGTH=343 /DNA_ID=CAMNT_0042923857 /DNA_START=76 /DNA_END=1107 /DNA_ORIENTATION=-
MGLGGSKEANYKEPKKVESQWFPEYEASLPTLGGKVILVTGCTSGTGLVCAKTCAKKGAAHVVLLNRPSSRATAAETTVKEAAADGTKVTTVECDLQSFESVRKAAATLKSMFGSTGIDVLCNNAGVMALEDKATADGYDVQMQTNHLSHFMLTSECVPLLLKAAEARGEARVVNHSSGARNFPNTALDEKYLGQNGGDLGGNGNSMLCGGARWQRYHQTKLANAVFTLALADRFKDTKLKALCAAPGLAATNLQVTTHIDGGMEDTWIMRWSQSAEDGTMPLLHCCIHPDAENGMLFEPQNFGHMKGPVGTHPFESLCTDRKARETLWKASEAACGAFPALG